MSENIKNDRSFLFKDDMHMQIENIMERVDFSVFMGEMGSSSKVIIFKEGDFKEELAPPNATIEEFNMDGQSYVRMHY